jgi:hypothetical protein
MLIAVLLKITQENAYIGFGLYLLLSVSFMIYTINIVDCEELEFQRKMLKTPKSRKKYYYMLNSI